MFYYHHDLTTALHSKLNGSLADQWLKAASQVNIECLADELRLLDSNEFAARFIELDFATQRELCGCLAANEVADLLIALRPITRRRVLRMLPMIEFARIFGHLPRAIQICGMKQLNHAKQARFWQLRKRTHQRFSFDTQVSQLALDTTVEDALAFYYSSAHRSHYIYVVDALGVLCGVIYGHMLPTLAVKQAPIGLYMEQVHTPIVAEHDRDFVAAQLQQQRTLELPVVDHDHRLVGVVDIDDLG